MLVTSTFGNLIFVFSYEQSDWLGLNIVKFAVEFSSSLQKRENDPMFSCILSFVDMMMVLSTYVLRFGIQMPVKNLSLGPAFGITKLAE